MAAKQSTACASALPEPRPETPSPERIEQLKTWQGLPVTVGELERIIGAARTMPEALDGIPGGKWWPALILSIINCAEFVSTMLELPATAYDRDKGTLRIGRKLIHLHAHAANALEAMRPYEREKLFPWPKDGGKRPYFMLYHDYQELLHRAGLPPMQKRPLPKLKKLGARYPEVMDCIDPSRPFMPMAGKPQRNRKRKPKRKKPRERFGMHLIGDESPEALKRYFTEVYEPLKLLNCSHRSVTSYKSVINGFSTYLSRDASLSDFTDDCLGLYKAWMHKRGYEPTTINNHLRHLLSLWRHAWKKRRVAELPRDVEFMAEPKHMPEAWSAEEMGRMLEAARRADGNFKAMPAFLFWPALILTVYDSGMRLGSVMQLRTEDFDLDTGEIIARADTQKQRADQIFRVHPETLEAVRAIHPERREFVFDYPEYERNKKWLYHPFNAILSAAGLPTSARDKFHRIRRTSATYLCDALGSEEAAQRHLGHSSMQVTRRYIDQTKVRKRVNAADVMVRPPRAEELGKAVNP